MKSDKQLIREGNYQEALGDNYNYKPIYVMIFENRTIIDQLDERFITKIEAIEWLKNNKEPLKEGQEYYFGNLNHDWL
jgi:hypothetical protein